MSWLRRIISTYRTSDPWMPAASLPRFKVLYSHTRISCILYLLESWEELARDSIMVTHVVEMLTSEETHNPISKV